MTNQLRSIQKKHVRQLNLVKQHLDVASTTSMLDIVKDIACIQLDPISAVARSHEIVMYSRMGAYDMAEYNALRFRDFHVFEYWAHAASMVLTDDFPLFRPFMQKHLNGESDWSRKIGAWVTEHADLYHHILDRLREEGPLPSRVFESRYERGVGSIGWTSGRDVTHMMDYLWNSGQVVVAGRVGSQRLWGLTEQFLPAWTPQEALTLEEITERAAQKSLKALGVATEQQIKRHFTRGRYHGLAGILKRLVKEGMVIPVKIVDEGGDTLWKPTSYIHRDDLLLLERIEAGDFTPKTTLLSPFDNLICDRERTEQLWDFFYRIEIYVPKPKREFGYYVLPILHGDQLIGRLDPNYNAKTRTLSILALHKEANAPDDAETQQAARTAIHELGAWLGAEQITFSDVVPPAWKSVTP